MGKALDSASKGELVLANVHELTPSPMLLSVLSPVHDPDSLMPSMVHICGALWSFDAGVIDLDLLTRPATTYATMTSADVGFRLAR